jgi:hypothetical protein
MINIYFRTKEYLFFFFVYDPALLVETKRLDVSKYMQSAL